MSIDVRIDGVQQTPVPKFITDRNGEFFGSLGVLSMGVHLVDCIFHAWGGYTEAKDSVRVEVKKVPVYLDVWTEDAANKAKTSFRGIEEVQFNCVLTGVTPADGGQRLAGMSIEISVDDEVIKTVKTNTYGIAEENLGKLGIGTHAIKGKFYPWADYEGAEDVENPVTVSPFPRILEIFPRLDKMIRNRYIWQAYAKFRWGGVSLKKQEQERFSVVI